ncbi:hypothetical protein BN59_01308 [Legionella massiliensis]|uniref:Uncharacterized protein n=1 Tax=Legionella massiliensis TaxID=1034943 RepID=A0A078KZ46_9GAMM|nr:hypothetical protein [Legionella massiliensis]CDZ77029.1 hypothetical protein BN59_01308 [Legionella massiliensis]CEE12767.1 hypothetical protein BN1094_01308 [Legionella massiliensis]
MSITVFTWKDANKGLGYKRAVSALMFGGNVGHAALEVTWPADEAGKALAKKYGDDDGLVIGKRTETIPVKQEDGSYRAVKGVVYFSYFSWWPGHANGHHINTFQDDQDSEWENEPSRPIAPRFKEFIFGETEVPNVNKTTVKGVFTREREVEKLRHIVHPSLEEDFDDDPAYESLWVEREDLLAELNRLQNKANIFRTEIESAAVEGRTPDLSLNLTNEEYDRIDTINKEINSVNRQIHYCRQDFQERFKSSGHEPDYITTMPTDRDNSSLTHTLNTEKILDEMAALSRSDQAYDFTKLNCSTTAGRVLRAGIDDRLSSAMREDGVRVDKLAKTYIVTPTNLKVFASKIRSEITHLASNAARVVDQDKRASVTTDLIEEDDLDQDDQQQLRGHSL